MQFSPDGNADQPLERNGILWSTDIPIGSKIKVRGGQVFAVFKRKKRTIAQKIEMPKRFDKFLGTIDAFGFGKLK
jgi:hypothetical protein